jgi:pyruvate formate lyase activating enzyme
VLGTVFDIKRYAIHDGPGIRTTVFMKGCPLRCAWCQNPEGQDPRPELALHSGRCIECGACTEVCPVDGGPVTALAHASTTGSGDVAAVRATADGHRCLRCGACADACASEARVMAGREMTVADVMAEIDRDQLFYEESGGGVTFSGGEPLLQARFLIACLRACRSRGYHTAVDTCGFTPRATLLSAAAHTDLFLYDLKLMDGARHERLVGVPNQSILDNLVALCQRGHAVWICVPLIPGINDGLHDLQALARFVRALPAPPPRRGPPPVHLLAYHRIGAEKYRRFGLAYGLESIVPPTPRQVRQAAEVLRAHGVTAEVGT